MKLTRDRHEDTPISPPTKTETVDTLIGRTTVVQGDLEFSGGIRIDGKVNGNITTVGEGEGTLVLSESGIIEGDIKVPHLVINGVVNGNIHSTGHVELQSNAQVTGDIRYAALEIGLGAALNGSLQSNDAAPAYDVIPGGIEADQENA